MNGGRHLIGTGSTLSVAGTREPPKRSPTAMHAPAPRTASPAVSIRRTLLYAVHARRCDRLVRSAIVEVTGFARRVDDESRPFLVEANRTRSRIPLHRARGERAARCRYGSLRRST